VEVIGRQAPDTDIGRIVRLGRQGRKQKSVKALLVYDRDWNKDSIRLDTDSRPLARLSRTQWHGSLEDRSTKHEALE